MELINRTDLETERLRRMVDREIVSWPHEKVRTSIRYSRGADFSGTCYYRTGRIYVNVGRHVRYPYDLPTQIARAESNATHWWKALYALRLADGYELALFVFLHEFFHWLVAQAGRNLRQKESMCDRFAARVLVQRYGVVVVDSEGVPVSPETWDFQDVERFVAAARGPGTRRAGDRRCATAHRPSRERERVGYGPSRRRLTPAPALGARIIRSGRP